MVHGTLSLDTVSAIARVDDEPLTEAYILLST